MSERINKHSLKSSKILIVDEVLSERTSNGNYVSERKTQYTLKLAKKEAPAMDASFYLYLVDDDRIELPTSCL